MNLTSWSKRCWRTEAVPSRGTMKKLHWLGAESATTKLHQHDPGLLNCCFGGDAMIIIDERGSQGFQGTQCTGVG